MPESVPNGLPDLRRAAQVVLATWFRRCRDRRLAEEEELVEKQRNADQKKHFRSAVRALVDRDLAICS